MERVAEEASLTCQSGRERVRTPKAKEFERAMHRRKPVVGNLLGTPNQRDRQVGGQDDSYGSEDRVSIPGCNNSRSAWRPTIKPYCGQ